MHQCLINNELPNLVSRLRQEYPFNFKEILETARNLKNLNENVFKETLRFFGDDNLDDDEDSASSLEDKNLVDRVIYNACNHASVEGSFDKFNIKKRWWTQEEDDQLKQLVDEFGAKNWKRIASYFHDRTDVQCLHRWQKVLNPKLIKGPWVYSSLHRQNKKMNL